MKVKLFLREDTRFNESATRSSFPWWAVWFLLANAVGSRDEILDCLIPCSAV